MRIEDSFECQFPEWALAYLEYGESDGLSAEDVRLADQWLGEAVAGGFVAWDITDDRNEFCANPAFGLPTSTTRVVFFRI